MKEYCSKITAHNNLEGDRGYYAEWRKPISKGPFYTIPDVLNILKMTKPRRTTNTDIGGIVVSIAAFRT